MASLDLTSEDGPEVVRPFTLHTDSAYGHLCPIRQQYDLIQLAVGCGASYQSMGWPIADTPAPSEIGRAHV